MAKLAGQGANLGLQDADELATVLEAALKKGLHPGDLVQSVNGQPTGTTRAFLDAVENVSPGDKVEIGVVRYQKLTSMEVEIPR